MQLQQETMTTSPRQEWTTSRANGDRSHASSPQRGAERLARALGWFSIGLGLAELAAPQALARAIGIADRRPWPLARNGHASVLRFFGAREIATGIGILAERSPAPWLWARVAADLLDLSYLGSNMRKTSTDSARLGAAAAAVAGVTALDIACSRRLSAPRSVASQVEADGFVRLVGSVSVNRPPDECYAFWRKLENLPRVMRYLESVVQTGDGRSHWKVCTPGGMRIEWNADITQDRPNELISWRARDGSMLPNDGALHFLPGPNGEGTLIHATLRYKPPGGKLAAAATALFGGPGAPQLKENLRRFKQVLETGEIITTEGQPHGPARTSLTRALSRS